MNLKLLFSKFLPESVCSLRFTFQYINATPTAKIPIGTRIHAITYLCKFSPHTTSEKFVPAAISIRPKSSHLSQEI